MLSSPQNRFLTALLLAAHVAFVVLNAFHIHEGNGVHAPGGIRDHTAQSAEMHGHSVADCPLRLFFSNPILPANINSSEACLLNRGVMLPLIADAEIHGPRSLHPSLRAPPIT